MEHAVSTLGEDQSFHSDSSTVICSNVRRVTLSPRQSRDKMADKESQELTELLGMLSAILNRAQPNQHQELIGVLKSQVCRFQAEDEEHDSSHSERAAMGFLYAQIFDEHDFFRARSLTRAVGNNGEFQVLLERLNSLLPAGRVSRPIPENTASNRSKDSESSASAIFRPRSPIPENIASNGSRVSSSLTMQHISSDGSSTQQSGSPVKKGDASMERKIGELLEERGSVGDVPDERASFNSDDSTEVVSSMVPSGSDGGAVRVGPASPDTTGVYTAVDRDIREGDQAQEQETSNTGTNTAAENELLFGNEEGNDSS